MTLICLASQKGSPGTSTAALAVAAALQPGEGRRKLLLEADGCGGMLGGRYRLRTEPGLVTLAAAARAGLEADELWRHTGQLPGGLDVVVCPEDPDQVHSALAAAGAELGQHLADRRDVDVIADLGRLVPGSPAIELAAASTALLMVARPVPEQLQPAARRLVSLRPRIRNLGWLLVGERPYGPADVEDTFGFPVVGVLADDHRSVEAIAAGAVTRRVRRHPYVRSATTVATTLRSWLSPLADAPAAATLGEPRPEPAAEAATMSLADGARPDAPAAEPTGAGPAGEPARPDGPTATDGNGADPVVPGDGSGGGADADTAVALVGAAGESVVDGDGSGGGADPVVDGDPTDPAEGPGQPGWAAGPTAATDRPGTGAGGSPLSPTAPAGPRWPDPTDLDGSPGLRSAPPHGAAPVSPARAPAPDPFVHDEGDDWIGS